MRAPRGSLRQAIQLVLVVLLVVLSSAVGVDGSYRATGAPNTEASSGLSVKLNNTTANASLALPTLSVASFGTWPMFDQNDPRTGAQSSERTLAPGNVSLLTLAKNFPFLANGPITGSAAVANGTAYFGSMGGTLYALNVSSATIHGPSSWYANTTGLPMKNCSGWPAGIMSTPAIWGRYAIVGTGDVVGKHGYGWVRAYNLTAPGAGQAKWSTNLSNYAQGSWAGAYVWSSPVVWDGNVYVGFASGGDCPLVQGALFELNATTGHVLHQANMTAPGTIGASIWSSPSIDSANNAIWVTTGNNHPGVNEPYASAIVELNLSTLAIVSSWQVPNIQNVDDDFGAGATLVSGPHGTSIAIATNKDDISYAVNRSNLSGGAIWQDSVGGPPNQGAVTPAAAGAGLVYLAGGPSLTYSYSGLPSGCSSTNTPTLLCTPSGAPNGIYMVEVRAQDALGHVGFANTSITVAPTGSFEISQYGTTTPYGVPVLGSTTIKVGVVHQSGSVNYAYTGLPPGCASSNTPSLPGTPTSAGAYQVEVYANETGGSQSSLVAVLTLSVNPQSGSVQALGAFDLDPTVSNGQSATLQSEFISTANAGSIWAVYPGNGTPAWKFGSAGFYYAGPTYANGLVIAAAIAQNYSWSTIEVLDAASGNLLATYNVSGMVDGEPAVADGRIYFGTATSTFRGNGKFYALDIPLYAQPTGAYLLPGSNLGPTFQFIGAGIGGSPPNTCVWNWGDHTANTVGCGVIRHTYTVSGFYTVTFTVTDAVAVTSVWTTGVFAYFSGCVWGAHHPCPVWLAGAGLSEAPCSPGSPVNCLVARTLTFGSYDLGGTPPYSYLWSFGDNGQSIVSYPTHTYPENGEYTVTLTVTDQSGYEGSAQLRVTIT